MLFSPEALRISYVPSGINNEEDKSLFSSHADTATHLHYYSGMNIKLSTLVQWWCNCPETAAMQPSQRSVRYRCHVETAVKGRDEIQLRIHVLRHTTYPNNKFTITDMGKSRRR